MKTFLILLVSLFLIKTGTYYALEKAVTYRNQRAVVLKKDLERKAEHVKYMLRLIEKTAAGFTQMWFLPKEYSSTERFIRDFEKIDSYDSLLIFVDNDVFSSGFNIERFVYEKLPTSARFISLKYDFLNFLVRQIDEENREEWYAENITPVLVGTPTVWNDSLMIEIWLFNSYRLTSSIKVKAKGKELSINKFPFYYKGPLKDISIAVTNPITKKTKIYEGD